MCERVKGLKCLDKNIHFYKKCNFIDAGVEMKYNLYFFRITHNKEKNSVQN